MESLGLSKENGQMILLRTVSVHQTTIAVLEKALKNATEQRDQVTQRLHSSQEYNASLTAQLNGMQTALDNERKARLAAEERLEHLREEMSVAHRQLIELHQLLMEDFKRRRQTEMDYQRVECVAINDEELFN